MKRRERKAIEDRYPELHELAVSEAPREACGLIEWDGRRMTLHPCENVATEPETSFVIEPGEQLALLSGIERRGTEFWGIYHAHPRGCAPSERDVKFAAHATVWWVIIGLVPADPADDYEVYIGRPGHLERERPPWQWR